MAISLDPPLRETGAPQLDRFDWQHLQRLTESLLAHEPDVLTASEYGRPGQAQFGIDTKAELRGGGCDVASCKAVEGIGKGQLATWSQDFLDHWDERWQRKRVRRFVLVTTADITPTQVNDAADVERERFAAINLGYELWGQPQLVEKMRPHPGIVAQFVGSDWVESICGQRQREALQPEGASVGVAGVATGEVAELRAMLSGEAEQRVARGLDDLRAGQVDAVQRTIADLRAEPLWTQLSPGARARVLRLATSTALHRKDLDAAVALAAEAEAIETANEPRIAARIAFAREGAQAGLDVLGTPTTRDGRQLQVAFQLTAGDLDGAEDVLRQLAKDEPDPETTRLQAWVALMRDRRGIALGLVAQLEVEAGHWLATIRTAALVRYAAALSPALSPEWFLNASPVDLDLVREDAEGQELLARSIAGLEDLVRRSDDIDDRRWLLAALANTRERREEAETLARSLIAEEPADPATIAWVLARRFDVDLAGSLDLLSARYARGEADQIEVRVYALMLVSREDAAAARAGLAIHAADQVDEDARREAEKWCTRLAPEGSSVGDVVPDTDHLVDAIGLARTTNDWDAVRAGFAVLAGGEKPEPPTLAVALMIGSEGRWDILAPHREAILSFATAEAVRVVAYLIAATDTDQALRTFLDEHRGAFRGGEIPPDVRRLVVDSQRRSGDLVGALAEARALSRHSGVSADRHLEAELHASIGDTQGAAHIVRDLLKTAELDPRAALGWGEALRASDMTLARDLWRYAVSRDEDRQHAVFAFMQAFSLGLEKEAAPLYSEVERAASEGSAAVRSFDVAELPEFIRAQNANAQQRAALYLDGRVPAHLLVEHENIGLDALVMGDGDHATGPLRLRLLRSGARPRHVQVGIAWPDWRLHMDLSALLVAAEFDLLDLVEQQPNPVTISSAVPSALLEMERKASPTQPARLDLLKSLADLVGDTFNARPRRNGDLVVSLVDPDNPSPRDFDLFQLVDAAFAAGALEEAESLAAKTAWRREGEPSAADPMIEAPLQLGSSLWLEGAAAEQLHRAQVLVSLCRSYDVVVDPNILAVTRAYVAAESAKAERASRLAELRERLRRGIEAGKYVFVRRNAAREAEVAEVGTQDAATASLVDMLIAEEVQGGVAWFEDRHVTGYPANNSHPIVEFVEVLEALGAAKILSTAELRGRLSRFLGAGGGFVQLEAEDIVPALRSAPIANGVLRETPALIAIRRNRAATRLLDERLKIGPSDDPEDSRPDEIQLLTSEMRLADACLTAIWSDTSQTIADCIVRSEWIWDTLRLERVLRSIPEEETEGAARMLATLCFNSSAEALATPTTCLRVAVENDVAHSPTGSGTPRWDRTQLVTPTSSSASPSTSPTSTYPGSMAGRRQSPTAGSSAN